MDSPLDFLKNSAEKFPRRIAYYAPDRRFRFQEVRDLVEKLAAAFAARGVCQGHAVGLLLRNSIEFVVSWMALARLGAASVPINFLINKPEELAFILSDCKARGLIAQKEFLTAAIQTQKQLTPQPWLLVTDTQIESAENLWDVLSRPPATISLPPPPSPEEVATILYTSGTTGRSKGVMLTHRNLASNALSSCRTLGIRHSEVFLCLLPMFHTFSWTTCVMVPMAVGCSTVIVPSLTPPTVWLKRMARHGATILPAIPPLYSVLAQEARGLKKLIFRYIFFRKLRFGISGAAPLPARVQQAFESAFRIPILEGYGLTETSPVVSCNRPGERKIGSVGRSLPDVQIKILGSDGEELGPDQEGEICVKGPNVMKGYYGLEQETRNAFTSDGWLKTGDIGILDAEGFLFIRDRKKDMIIVHGLKVYPAQIEQILSAHPDVAEAAVIGVPNATGEETIRGYVVAKKGRVLDKTALLKLCREKLPPYQRPRDIEIRTALPKNALQKVLKRLLRQQALQ